MIPWRPVRRFGYSYGLSTYLRYFSVATELSKNTSQLPPRPTLPDHEVHHVSLKGSGPGGQKINKTNSAIQMTHVPTGIVVKSQATRSRTENYKIARRILAEKIELLEKGDESRAAKKEERARKKKASATKKKQRKYRKLEEEKSDAWSDSAVEKDGANENQDLNTDDIEPDDDQKLQK